MSFSYPQVVIGSSRDAFTDVTSADDYFAQQPGNDAAWAALSATQKAQGLRQATLMLDRLSWAGAMADATNALSWPRTGIVDKEGNTVDSASLPTQLGYATCELGLAIVNDPTIASNAQGTTSNIKRTKAGSAEVEFFSPVHGTRIPTAAYDWIAAFFGDSTGDSAPGPTGTSSCDPFACPDKWNSREWP